MSDLSIQNLRAALIEKFGKTWQPYGSPFDEEHGVGFKITGIPVTFSALTMDGTLPLDTFDIQVESIPPGDYVYSAEVSLVKLMDLIDVFSLPGTQWP